MPHYLFVRSQDRSMGNSSAFTVQLPQTYRSITSISLISAELPFSFYNIDTPYLTGVRFVHNGTSFDLTLNAGFYQIADLQAALLFALQAAIPSAGVAAVTYAMTTGLISIIYTSGLAFSVVQTASGQLGRILGTDPLGTTQAALGGVLTFPKISQLFPIFNVIMRVAELPSLMASTNNQQGFARLQLAATPQSVVLINNSTGTVNNNDYNTPIASLSSMTITLYTADGQPLDMHGVDWSFTLLINDAT